MHRHFRNTLAAALTAGLVGTAVSATAQSTAPAAPAQTQTSDATRTELKQFDRYLGHHPRLAKQLRANPPLANDPQFLAKHTGLQKFLTAHPAVQKQLQENPTAVLQREPRHATHTRKSAKHQAQPAQS